MNEKRLFVAIPLPEDIRSEIILYRDSLGLPLKWIPAANLHVTVLFLGNIPEDQVAGIVRRLRDLYVTVAPFVLEATSLTEKRGRFQNMVWGSFDRSPEFESLCSKTAEALQVKQDKKAIPHINLVRSKSRIRRDKLPLVFGNPLLLSVKEITLYESRLDPAGAIYTVVENFALKG